MVIQRYTFLGDFEEDDSLNLTLTLFATKKDTWVVRTYNDFYPHPQEQKYTYYCNSE